LAGAHGQDQVLQEAVQGERGLAAKEHAQQALLVAGANGIVYPASVPAVEIHGQQPLDQRKAADGRPQQESRSPVPGRPQDLDLLQRPRQQLHIHTNLLPHRQFLDNIGADRT
jgi:hypothetical protein